ncbi:MAG: endonuclease [Luteibaculum sp.]
MKSLILKSIAALSLAASPFFAMAQSILPTSWDADGNPPMGWSTSGTDKYANNGNNARPSISFKATGQRVDIYFSDVAGEVEFYLKGQTFNGATFQGTFEVQESANGSTYTTAISIVDSQLPADKFTRFAFTADPNSKYLRFIHTNKVSGSNVACDDILINKLSPTGPDFNFVDLGQRIPLNGEILFEGDLDVRTVGIVNMGNSNLSITSRNLTLNEGSSFSLTDLSNLSSIAPGDTGKLDIKFQPPTLEQYFGTIEFTHNQPFKSPYIINLNGLGGATANEPNSAPFTLLTSETSTWRSKLSYNGSDAESYLIVLATSPLTGTPEDGKAYDLSETIGNGKVVYNGNSSSAYLSNLVAGTSYYVQVFPFNGSGNKCNYKTTGLPPVKRFSTPANMISAGYYNGIDPSQNSLISDLFNTINPHTQQFYDNYDEILVSMFLARDTTQGRKVVDCAYTGFQYVYNEPFNFAVLSREHTYSFSWMPSQDQEAPFYSDYHNLLLVHQDKANAPRSNYPLGYVATPTSTFLEGTLGKDQGGNTVYEPRDEFKGDAARAQMYMAVAYNGLNGQDWSLPDFISSGVPYGVDQDILKEWHKNDPPSAFEMSRNDFIDSLQKNRNPFIDNPNWACYIDFINMTYISNPGPGCLVSVEELNNLPYPVKLYPVPSNGNFSLEFGHNFSGTVQLSDMQGKSLFEIQVVDITSYQGQQDLNPGIYHLIIRDKTGKQAIKKLLVK